mgnify:CR=1 FL=1
MSVRLSKVQRALKRERIRQHRDKAERMRHRKWRWEVILNRIPVTRPTVGVEVGVWKGATARRILAARPLCTHYMVDPWHAPLPGERYASAPGQMQKRGQDVFDGAYRAVVKIASEHGKRGQVIRAFSKDAARQFEAHSLDYVFIDAEHTYEGVREDILCWLPKVKKGGWIGGHDYGNHPKFPGVKKAVDEAFPDGVELDVDHTWFVAIGGQDDNR